jgi:hypothetical protein
MRDDRIHAESDSAAHRKSSGLPAPSPDGGQRTRRAFSLFALEVDLTSAELVALLLEPDADGAWRLLVSDSV